MIAFSGHLSLEAEAGPEGRTALARQSFRAPYHVGKGYWHAEDKVFVALVVNPTAGILAGDRLESSVAVGCRAALLVTTPSASRVFRMTQGAAACRQYFKVGEGGWLEFLPEPLVPHAGSSYTQSTRFEVDAGGEVFASDLLMPGRLAHGDAWKWDRLVIGTEVRASGMLVLRERFDQTGRDLKALAALAGSGDEACFGNCILVSQRLPAAPDWLPALHALHGDGVWIGASPLCSHGWNIKFVAAGSLKLRETLRRIRAILAKDFPRLGCDARKL